MAHQQDFFKQQEQSPYIANEGAVGELGQPKAARNDVHPDQFATQQQQQQQQQHHQEGIHGSSPGIQQQQHHLTPGTRPQEVTTGNRVQQQQDELSPGFQHHQSSQQQELYGDRVPGTHYPAQQEHEVASTDRGLHFGGGKPDQHPLEATHDVNIGHGHEPLSSASEVSPSVAAEQQQLHHKKGVGEKMKDTMRGVKEVVTGHKQHQQAHHPEGEPRVADKMKNAVTGQRPGQGSATGNATSGSVVPGDEDYIGKFAGASEPHGAFGGGAASGVHEGGWPRPVPPQNMFKPGSATFPSNKTRGAFNSDTGGAGHGASPYPDAPADKSSAYDKPRKEGAMPGLSSTPAEPDVPDEHHATGAEYVDSHGKVQHEGPRDDNVKKEGLMSKMMDKLHIGGGGKTSPTQANS